MVNPTSESPTHPDAPRGGGETPDIAAILATVPAEDLALVEHLERCTHMHVTRTEPDQVYGWMVRRDKARVQLLQRMSALLARHRDGERWERTLRNLRAACVTENPEWGADDTAVIGIRVTRDVYEKAMSSAPPATPPAASPEPVWTLEGGCLKHGLTGDDTSCSACYPPPAASEPTEKPLICKCRHTHLMRDAFFATCPKCGCTDFRPSEPIEGTSND